MTKLRSNHWGKVRKRHYGPPLTPVIGKQRKETVTNVREQSTQRDDDKGLWEFVTRNLIPIILP